MAIIIESKERRVNWFPIVIGVVIVVSAVAALYFLFFSAAPLIETVAPIRLESAVSLSKINVDPNVILDDAVYKTLKSYIADPTPGVLGRQNPFLPF
jgi:hypothetical protein